ncbi:hydantoinase B/oxoprolinase family protein [Paenibacillus riograndensis]|uniref:hydantoinase B/oxoprolinase family protein n=1 Tax=Paenibacillus riograndensis TaxID=483937 RepID=UPI0002ED9E09|nr:hydantoinase B/oxoprolinase family protein [Paenibacillus riograndensis]
MPPVHSIEDQIIYGKIAAVSRHAGEQLQRISRSPLIAESRAFAAGIVTEAAGLVHQIQGEAEHLYALRASTRAMYDHFAYDLEEGDVLISADVYKGGTKGQMLTMVLPFFLEGELTLSPVIRVQLTDLAGEYPGGYHPEAFEMWQESMRITPVKLYSGGKLQRDVQRFVLANSRTPGLLASDLDALRASLLQAQTGLRSIIQAYGLSKVARAIGQMKAHTQEQVLNLLPEGRKEWCGAADFSASKVSGRVQVRMQREGNLWKADFTGSASQVEAPFNCSEATTSACAVVAILAEHLESLPVNDGLLDVFDFKLPAGSIVNPAYPSATALGYHTAGQAVAAAVTHALNGSDNNEGKFPAVHGAAPLTVLYSPIGSQKQTVPVFLELGYTASAGGGGPPVLHSGRSLASAEELEWRSGLRMTQRELAGDEGMEVRVELLDGSWEACIFVPDQADSSGLSVAVESCGEVWKGTVTGLPISAGATIHYTFARNGGGRPAEKEVGLHGKKG